MFLGFRSISSDASPWGEEYYAFCETWHSQEKYRDLLNNINLLSHHNINDTGKWFRKACSKTGKRNSYFNENAVMQITEGPSHGSLDPTIPVYDFSSNSPFASWFAQHS